MPNTTARQSKSNMLCLDILTVILLQLSLVLAANTTAWKSRNIYFALTDRIARNESDGGGSSCSDLGQYCGGTFKGLQSKLDYIRGMGFDAIWITPVVESMWRGHNTLELKGDFFYHFPVQLTDYALSFQITRVDTTDTGPRTSMPSTTSMARLMT